MSVAAGQEHLQRKRPIRQYLQIAMSVTCGVLCLLLIVLWARSYSTMDDVRLPVTSSWVVRVTSIESKVIFTYYRTLGPSNIQWTTTDFSNAYDRSVTRFKAWKWVPIAGHLYGFVIPQWFPLLALTSLAIVPWVRWRFSLRTLLIVTAVIAIILGIIAISNA
jgi:hypothetical protein